MFFESFILYISQIKSHITAISRCQGLHYEEVRNEDSSGIDY